MEEEYDTPDPEFVKGFNEGYVLAQHLPDLAEQIGKAVGDGQRSAGFQTGREQLLKEQRRERFPAWLRGDYTSGADAAPDQMPDKTPEGGIEPDR